MPPKKVSGSINTLNTPYLIIVESPSKCAKIEKYLGFQYKCIASKGHIREIKKVNNRSNHFNPEYSIIKEKESVVNDLKTITSHFSADNILLGTDDDREGEAIAWHICKVCNLNIDTTKRILFREITQKALLDSVKNPTHIRMNIVYAQQARQVLDRMIGFQISPILSKLIVHDNSKFLSAGRCQTPTLKLVYDLNLKNMESNQNNLYYKIEGTFLQDPTSLITTLNYNFNDEKSTLSFLEESKIFSHILSIYPKQSKKTQPSSPFNTSKLLQAANSNLGFSPKFTMEICQQLYQNGYITYMRSESTKYSKTFLSHATEYITTNFGENYLGNHSLLENKDSSNPHEAIRVTHLETLLVSEPKWQSIYKIIWKRTLESCMSQYEYEEHKIKISAPQNYFYETHLEIPIFLGWKIINSNLEDLNSLQQKMAKYLFQCRLFQNKKVDFQNLKSILSMGEREKHYQEASLIQKLESLGIGRPSTFSMLVETVKERKYILKENLEGEEKCGVEYILNSEKQILQKEIQKIFGAKKNQLCIQPLGIQTINILYQHFQPLFNYDYTSQMEEQLDDLVRNPSKNWYSLCESCEDVIKKCIEPLKQIFKKKYDIDNNHRIVFGKSGVMVEYHENEQNKIYKSIKQNFELDIQKIENGTYKISEILELPTDYLGEYLNNPVYIKNGPYGPYVTFGQDKKESIKSLVSKAKPIDQITLEEIVDYLENKNDNHNSSPVLRSLNMHYSVRKGKFGHYIFHKTPLMKKPKFVNIRKCPYNVLKDDSALILEWAAKNH